MLHSKFIVLGVIIALSSTAAVAQRADRVERMDRVNRVQDRVAARDRITDRVIRDRVEERVVDDVPVREIDIDPDVTSASDTVIIVDERGDRIRKGEVLALNPSPSALEEIERQKLREVRRREFGGGVTLHVFRSQTGSVISNLIETLRELDPGGIYAPNHVFAPSEEKSQIGATAGIALPVSGEQCDIGIIDGPIDALVPALNGKIARTARFDKTPKSNSWHGTAVAYRLVSAAQGRYGVSLLNICAADVFSADVSGTVTAEVFAAALNWQMQEDVGLINASLAGPDNDILAYMVSRFVAGGGTLVAAVGNGGPLGRDIYPAAYQGVIGVTAFDEFDRVYPLATQGAHVDVAAFGVDLDFSPLGIDIPVSGTSFAAPVMTAWLFAHEDVAQTWKNYLVDLGEPGWDDHFGHGGLSLGVMADTIQISTVVE